MLLKARLFRTGFLLSLTHGRFKKILPVGFEPTTKGL